MFELSVNSEMTMSSREIAELTGKQHFHVKRDIESMLNELKLDASKFGDIYFDSMNREQTEYRLDKDHTECLLTGYSAVLRMKVIKRWKELEAQSQPKVPQTYADALLLAATQAKELEEKSQALALAAPKVEFVDRYVESTGLMTFRQVAKQLEIKETAFRSFLVAIKAMYLMNGSWMAYSNHLDAGRFVQKTGENNGHAFVTTKFTPKGVEWVAKKWGEIKGMAA